MPSSPNRRRVEIPEELYERLRERAEKRQIPVAAYVTWLLIDGLEEHDVQQLHPTIDQRLDELLAIVRQIQAQHQTPPREYVRLELPEGYEPLRRSVDEDRVANGRRQLVAELRREGHDQQ